MKNLICAEMYLLTFDPIIGTHKITNDLISFYQNFKVQSEIFTPPRKYVLFISLLKLTHA